MESAASGYQPGICPIVDPSTLAFISLVMGRFSGGNLDAQTAVDRVAQTAYRYCSDLQGKEEAINWADGFVFPKSVFHRDAAALALHDGCLADLVASVHRSATADRFSEERVRDVIPPTDPHFEYILALSRGMRIRLPEPYVPLSIPPPPRALYRSLQAPLNKMIYAQWETGKALILPSKCLESTPRIHYNPVHWTISRGKAEGRLLIDPSDSAQETPLNCDSSVRQWTDDNIGKIVHPTLPDYILMILSFIEAQLSTQQGLTLETLIPRLRLFKMDLKGAFTLLNYHPQDAGLMSSALTEELTLISIVAGLPSII